MATFLESENIKTGKVSYYVGGCRVSKQVYETAGDGVKSCFVTTINETHIRKYHEHRL